MNAEKRAKAEEWRLEETFRWLFRYAKLELDAPRFLAWRTELEKQETEIRKGLPSLARSHTRALRFSVGPLVQEILKLTGLVATGRKRDFFVYFPASAGYGDAHGKNSRGQIPTAANARAFSDMMLKEHGIGVWAFFVDPNFRSALSRFNKDDIAQYPPGFFALGVLDEQFWAVPWMRRLFRRNQDMPIASVQISLGGGFSPFLSRQDLRDGAWSDSPNRLHWTSGQTPIDMFDLVRHGSFNFTLNHYDNPIYDGRRLPDTRRYLQVLATDLSSALGKPPTRPTPLEAARNLQTLARFRRQFGLPSDMTEANLVRMFSLIVNQPNEAPHSVWTACNKILAELLNDPPHPSGIFFKSRIPHPPYKERSRIPPGVEIVEVE